MTDDKKMIIQKVRATICDRIFIRCTFSELTEKQKSYIINDDTAFGDYCKSEKFTESKIDEEWYFETVPMRPGKEDVALAYNKKDMEEKSKIIV